jgi:hypothetical protein
MSTYCHDGRELSSGKLLKSRGKLLINNKNPGFPGLLSVYFNLLIARCADWANSPNARMNRFTIRYFFVKQLETLKRITNIIGTHKHLTINWNMLSSGSIYVN